MASTNAMADDAAQTANEASPSDFSESSIIALFRNQSKLGKDPKLQSFKESWVAVITCWMYDLIQCRGTSVEEEHLLITNFYKYFILGDAIEMKIQQDDKDTDDDEEVTTVATTTATTAAVTTNTVMMVTSIQEIDAQQFIAQIDIRLVILLLFFYSDFFQWNSNANVTEKNNDHGKKNETPMTSHQSEKSVVTDKEDDSDGDQDKTKTIISFSSHSPEMSAILGKLYSIYSYPFEASHEVSILRPTATTSLTTSTTGNNKLVLSKPALFFQAVNNHYMPSVYAFPRVLSERCPHAVKFFLCLLRIVGKSYLTVAQEINDSSSFIRLKDCSRFCDFLGRMYLVAEPGSDSEWTILEILQDCISTPVVFAGFRSCPGMMVALLCRTIEKNLGKRRFVSLDILRHYCSDPFILETLYEEEDEDEGENDDEMTTDRVDGEEEEENNEVTNRSVVLVLLDIIRQAEIFAKYRAWKILTVISTLRIKWLEKYSDVIMKEIEVVLSRNDQQPMSTTSTNTGNMTAAGGEEQHQYTAEDDADDYLHELPELKQKMKKEIISLLVNIQMSDWFQRFIHYHDNMLPKVVQLLRDKDSDTCSAASLWLFNSLRVTSLSQDSSIQSIVPETKGNSNHSLCSEAQMHKLKQFFDHKTKGNNPASFYSVSFPLLFQLSDELQRIQHSRIQMQMKGGAVGTGGSNSTHEYYERYRNYLFIIAQKLMVSNNNMGCHSINSIGAFDNNRSVMDGNTSTEEIPSTNAATTTTTATTSTSSSSLSSNVNTGNSYSNNEEKERKNAIRALCKMRLLQHCSWTIELFFEETFELIESTLDAFQLLMNKTDPLNLLVLHGVCTLLMDLLLVLEQQQNNEMFDQIIENKYVISRLTVCGFTNLLLHALSIVTFPPIVQLLLGMIGKLLKLESFQEILLLQGCQRIVKENVMKWTKESIIRQINESKRLPFEENSNNMEKEEPQIVEAKAAEVDGSDDNNSDGDEMDADMKEIVAQAKRWDYQNQITNLWVVVHILVNYEVDGHLPSTPLHMNKRNQLVDKLEYLANNFSQMPTLLEHELLMTLQVFDLLLYGKQCTSTAIEDNGGHLSSSSVYLTWMKRNCHLFAKIMEDLIQGLPVTDSSVSFTSPSTPSTSRWINNILSTNTTKKSLLLVVKIMCQIWDNEVVCPNESTKQEWSAILQKLPWIAQRYFSCSTQCQPQQANEVVFGKATAANHENTDLLNYTVTLSSFLQFQR